MTTLERVPNLLKTTHTASLPPRNPLLDELGQDLPTGYSFTSGINPSDAGRIIQEHFRGSMNYWQNRFLTKRISIRAQGLSNFEIGLLHDLAEQGEQPGVPELVGMARLAVRGTQGEFDSLIVQAAHRGQGLGRALIDARLGLADYIGVNSLYIEPLYDTNAARDYYSARGFVLNHDGALLRGPEPRSLIAHEG